MVFCHKCGEDTPPAFFNKSGTICDDCWRIHDMDRFKEVRPKNSERPTAKCALIERGKRLGVMCPHCDHKINRSLAYFVRDPQTERCPKCMNHYTVKKGTAI